MCRIGFRFRKQHLIFIKPVKLFRISPVKAVADDGFRRIIILLIVKTVYTAKIRNSTFCGNSRTTEKYYIITLTDPLFQQIHTLFHDLIHHFRSFPLPHYFLPRLHTPLPDSIFSCSWFIIHYTISSKKICFSTSICSAPAYRFTASGTR